MEADFALDIQRGLAGEKKVSPRADFHDPGVVLDKPLSMEADTWTRYGKWRCHLLRKGNRTYASEIVADAAALSRDWDYLSWLYNPDISTNKATNLTINIHS